MNVATFEMNVATGFEMKVARRRSRDGEVVETEAFGCHTGTYSGQEVVRSISRRTVARVDFDFREEGCSRFLVFRGIEMCFFGCEGVISV